MRGALTERSSPQGYLLRFAQQRRHATGTAHWAVPQSEDCLSESRYPAAPTSSDSEAEERPHAPRRAQRHPLLPPAGGPAAGRHRERHLPHRLAPPLHSRAGGRSGLRAQHRRAGLPSARAGRLRGEPPRQRVRRAERDLPAAGRLSALLRRAAGRPPAQSPLRLHLRQPGARHLPRRRLAGHHRRHLAVGGSRRLRRLQRPVRGGEPARGHCVAAGHAARHRLHPSKSSCRAARRPAFRTY